MSGNDFFYTLTNTNTLIIMSSLKCSMLFNDGCINGDAAASIHLNWLSNLMALKKDTFSNIKKKFAGRCSSSVPEGGHIPLRRWPR